jgi:hypothetical protein
VRVASSPTLENIGAVRAVVTFNLDPPGPITRRYNLMEGHLSFALFVGPNGSVTGTILDRDGNWLGATSAVGLVQPGRWYTGEIQHDGINQALIFLDGAPIGANYSVRGPVRSLGPHGLAIGHWPEAPATYTFAGHLREAWLYAYDPFKDANGLLDPCCMDREALDQAAARLRAQGATADQVEQKARDILAFGYDLVAAVRGDDEGATKQQEALAQAAWAAFTQKDQAGYTLALAQLAMLTQSRLGLADMAALRDRQADLLKSLPLPWDELTKLVSALCWDKVGMQPQQLVDVAEHLTRLQGKGPDDV